MAALGVFLHHPRGTLSSSNAGGARESSCEARVYVRGGRVDGGTQNFFLPLDLNGLTRSPHTQGNRGKVCPNLGGRREYNTLARRFSAGSGRGGLRPARIEEGESGKNWQNGRGKHR